MEKAGSPPPPPPPAPTAQNKILLDKYELSGLLGYGSFAKVYRGHVTADSVKQHVAYGRPAKVAIKVINKSRLPNDTAAELILREVSIMRRLPPHPNIVRLHEVMATRSKIYLVMDLAQGGDLLSRLKARKGVPVPEPTVRRWFRQLVSAVRFCHKHGVAHRDIKPQNLLLDGAGNLLVSDFGLSALMPECLGRDGLLHTTCGTPAFLAPEVLGRRAYDGARADAWSCGVVLYVILSGQLPFDDSNVALLYRKAMRREVVYPRALSAHSCRLISRLLEPNPERRMTVEQLAEIPWVKGSATTPLGLTNVKKAAGTDGLDAVAADPCGINAFSLIAMSSGLNLSGLFEEETAAGRRFMSKATVEEVVAKVEEVGCKMGYTARSAKWGSVRLNKEGSTVVVEVDVMDIAEQLRFGEVRVSSWKAAEFGEEGWAALQSGLEDIVVNWHSICASL